MIILLYTKQKSCHLVVCQSVLHFAGRLSKGNCQCIPVVAQVDFVLLQLLTTYLQNAVYGVSIKNLTESVYLCNLHRSGTSTHTRSIFFHLPKSYYLIVYQLTWQHIPIFLRILNGDDITLKSSVGVFSTILLVRVWCINPIDSCVVTIYSICVHA